MKLLMDKVFLFALIVFLFLFSLLAHATEIEIHITSVHYVPGDFNQVNPGIGFVYKNIAVGHYLNSFARDTIYLAYHKKVWTHGGYEIGVASGYDLPIAAALFYQRGFMKFRLLPGAVGISYIRQL